MQENSPIKARILQYLDYKQITRYKFYQNTGITRGILDQNNGISEENIARFIAYYKDVSYEWLLTGEGNMLKIEDTLQAHRVETGGIPLIPINAMAGIAKGEVSVLDYECEHYIVPIFKEAEFLIPVKGSSMIPKYNSGDIIACKWVPIVDIFFQWNKVYVLDTNQGALIKRIHPGKDDQHIQLVSDNDKYPPFQIALSSINAIAIVIGVIRLE